MAHKYGWSEGKQRILYGISNWIGYIQAAFWMAGAVLGVCMKFFAAGSSGW